MLDTLTAKLGEINDFLYLYVVIVLLVAGGIYFTVGTRGAQFRHFANMWKYIFKSRRDAAGGISSFQAFAVGMSTRIGIGNITGVAVALALGGTGAIFWMWVVALLGMATSFVEATLSQLFKESAPDGTYRGGVAYFVTKGLKSKTAGAAAAVLLIFSMVIAMPMVQSNAIASTAHATHGTPHWIMGAILLVLTGAAVWGGVRGVARVTEILSPVMAIAYILIALYILAINFGAIPAFFSQIFAGAFGLREGLAGIAGGVMAGVINGVRRGLFSNEAGMGTNSNTAATATVNHPVQQGLIQSVGVFIDTLIICTLTAFIVMSSGLFKPGITDTEAAGGITAAAVNSQMGSWMAWPMTIMILVLGLSSTIGSYYYADNNLQYLGLGKGASWVLRACSTFFSGFGTLLALPTVFTLMDTAMAIITIINVTGLLLLSKWVFGALRDYEAQRASGVESPWFVSVDNPHMPGEIPGSVWTQARSR